MKPYACPNCSNLVYFENDACLRCGLRLGYRPWCDDIAALSADGGYWLTGPGAPSPGAFFCDNAAHAVCNWLVEDEAEGRLCRACRHNVLIPDLSFTGNIDNWAKIEQAKRYVFYSLMRWNLPIPVPAQGGGPTLSFSFAADMAAPSGSSERVVTGHESGHITINLAEADDAERERTRVAMGEPYRTLIGHFRHELGHFYWDLLVARQPIAEEFRALFGDERADYSVALQRHYADGAPVGWQERYVSAYASAHPWEDFAETWAHYLHMTDGLETALSFGLRFADAPGSEGVERTGDYDPYQASCAHELVERWVPVSIALNSINRSMGQPDVYPFVLSSAVIEKLEFIHRLVRGGGQAKAQAA